MQSQAVRSAHFEGDEDGLDARIEEQKDLPVTASPFLALEGLDKAFGALAVLRQVSLAVEKGEVLALLGPSGSGKTTLLRLLAGFENPDRGRIRVGGEEVTRLPPARRRFGMVFQHYALFPHLTVAENVAFGLEAQGGDRAAARARVAEVLALVGLDGFEDRRIDQISGGQQQRVALARALAPEPRVLLLDEPLSNLDPSLRERTRLQLRAAIERVAITTVLVTHEQEEAFELGDRVALLHDGRLQQVGTPEQLYGEPANRFVATFIGRASALAGRLEEIEGGAARVRIEGGGEVVSWRALAAEELAAGERVELVVRPEALRLVDGGSPDALSGRVVGRRYGGPVTYYRVALGPGVEVEVLAAADAARVGDRVAVAPGGDAPPPRAFRRTPEAP